MSKEKPKSSIQLGSKEGLEKKSQAAASDAISFDVYFQKLLKVRKSVLAHHKAPMMKYAEQKGALKASEAEFDEIFKNY